MDTNDVELDQQSLEETRALSCSPEGRLLFDGFLQLYQLQTTNDVSETWKDLARHGYDNVGMRCKLGLPHNSHRHCNIQGDPFDLTIKSFMNRPTTSIDTRVHTLKS